MKLSCLVKIVLQYILPSGIKVQLVRNYWGIDVSIYTPKANGIQKGLCTYQGTSGGPRLIDTNFGNQQRYSNIKLTSISQFEHGKVKR